jgi:hypothetical protein
MMNIKCPQCGLVNFASAPECKRCHYEFVAAAASTARAAERPLPIVPGEQQPPVQNISQPAQAPKTFTTLPVFEPVATPIGGWLIVFALLMGLSLALSAYAIPQSVSMYSTDAYKVLTTEGSALYISGFSSWFTFEFIWNCFLTVSLILLFVRFFKKSKSFPNLMIALLSLSVLVEGFGYLTAITFAKELSQQLRSVVHNAQVPEIIPSYFGLIILLALGLSMLWIWYFLTSRRVETTFVY